MKLLKRLTITMALATTFLTGVTGLSVVSANSVSAASCANQTFFLPKWYDGLCDSQTGRIMSPVALQSGASEDQNADTTKTGLSTFISKIAMNIVTILLTIVGYVSLGFIIWGGFKYMISGDSANGTSAAKKTILNAIIGLILSIMSVAIVKVVGDAIVK